MPNNKKPNGDANRDPITGAPGAHPIGVSVGAAGGAAAGAAIGVALGGPVGAAAGAAIGAVAGGLAGKDVAEAVSPSTEDAYWRDNFQTREYVPAGSTYDAYRAAYEHGWESYRKLKGGHFNLAEPELRREWEAGKYNSKMPWERARRAAQDSWQRVERAIPVPAPVPADVNCEPACEAH